MAVLRIVWGALGALALAAGAQARPLEFDDIAREGELRLLAERPDPHAYGYVSGPGRLRGIFMKSSGFSAYHLFMASMGGTCPRAFWGMW